MKISQSTVSRHLEEAHRKIAKALVLGFAIRIANPLDFFHCNHCGHTWRSHKEDDAVKLCENCKSTDFHAHVHSAHGSQIQNSLR
jgi:Zn finger protein HypA/HybF involved in hydrogenase expression